MILTANEDTGIAQEIIQQGAQAYCFKGLSLPLFVEIIHQIQQGKFWYDPKLTDASLEPINQANPKKPQISNTGRSRFRLAFQELSQQVLNTVTLMLF